MITISSLTSFLQDRLNSIDPDNYLFVVSYWGGRVDTNYNKLLLDVPGTDTVYCGILDSFNGQFEPLPGLLIANATGTLQICAPMEEKSALELCAQKLVEELNGRTFTYGDDKMTFKMEFPHLIEMTEQNLRELKDEFGTIPIRVTELMGFFNIPFSLFVCPSHIIMGNELAFSIGLSENGPFVKAYKTAMDGVLAHDQEYVPVANKYITQAVNKSTARQLDVSILLSKQYDEDSGVVTTLIHDIIDLETSTSQYRNYYIKISADSDNGLLGGVQKMVLQKGSVNYALGEPVSISATFVRAFE